MRISAFVLAGLITAIMYNPALADRLTRTEAAEKIEASWFGQAMYGRIPTHRDADRMAEQHGAWRVSGSMSIAVSPSYSDLLSLDPSASSSRFFMQLTPDAIALGQVAYEIEVTGIAKSPHSDAIRTAEFEARYTELPPRLAPMASIGWRGEATFQEYDDGWRLKDIDRKWFKEPFDIVADRVRIDLLKDECLAFVNVSSERYISFDGGRLDELFSRPDLVALSDDTGFFAEYTLPLVSLDMGRSEVTEDGDLKLFVSSNAPAPLLLRQQLREQGSLKVTMGPAKIASAHFSFGNESEASKSLKTLRKVASQCKNWLSGRSGLSNTQRDIFVQLTSLNPGTAKQSLNSDFDDCEVSQSQYSLSFGDRALKEQVLSFSAQALEASTMWDGLLRQMESTSPVNVDSFLMIQARKGESFDLRSRFKRFPESLDISMTDVEEAQRMLERAEGVKVKDLEADQTALSLATPVESWKTHFRVVNLLSRQALACQ